MNKKLIINIGTGRSGSVSLSNFLSNQKKMRVLHEGKLKEKGIRKLIKWKNDEDELIKWLNKLLKIKDNNNFVGDTGMYFLPYVELIIKNFPNTKIIGLIRDKKEVVNSYIKKTAGRNHWYNHDGKKWKIDKKWDDCFPTYNEKDKQKALEKYWDEYYISTKNLMKKYPTYVKMWTIKEFNSIKGKNEILDFIEYSLKRKINDEIRLNQNKFSIKKFIKKWI